MTNTSSSPLSGPTRAPASGGTPRQLVVFLHGYGADGADLIGLAPFFAQALPNAEFVAPNAPERCNMGFGYQWFGITNMDPGRLAAGVRNAAPLLDAFLDDALRSRGLTYDQLALIGFSQGTMMALHVGLRRTKQLAGIVGFSGMLAGPEALGAEIKSRPPLVLLHGDSDEMLPHQLTERAAEVLRQNGVAVRTHIAQGVGHGIDETGLARAAHFLLDVFKLPVPQT